MRIKSGLGTFGHQPLQNEQLDPENNQFFSGTYSSKPHLAGSHDARCYPSRRAQLALRFLRVAVAPGSGARGSDIPGLRCGGGFFMFFPIGDGSKLRWSMVSGFWMFLDGLEHDFYFCIYWE